MKHTLLSLLFLTVAHLASAQDKIFTTTQKAPIEGEVTEISVGEVRYKPAGRPFPVVSVDKQDVLKIVYANGEVYMVHDPMKDFSVYNGQKKWNAKIDMLSPLVGYTRFYLEEAKRPGRSAEYELNIIGLGKNPIINSDYYSYNGAYHRIRFDAKGVGIGYGMKFLRLPDYVNGQVRLRHILQGSYVKPAISFAYYTRNFISQDNIGNPITTRKPIYAINPSVTFGKQWILDNTISVEMYSTIGYGIDNVRSTQKEMRNDVTSQPFLDENAIPFNSFGYTRFSSGDFGLSMNAGFRLGYLFHMKKPKQK